MEGQKWVNNRKSVLVMGGPALHALFEKEWQMKSGLREILAHSGALSDYE